MSKVFIISYHAIYSNGIIDRIHLKQPLEVDDKEEFRKRKIKELGCSVIGLTYVEPLNDNCDEYK